MNTPRGYKPTKNDIAYALLFGSIPFDQVPVDHPQWDQGEHLWNECRYDRQSYRSRQRSHRRTNESPV
jgi:hypothetical protein